MTLFAKANGVKDVAKMSTHVRDVFKCAPLVQNENKCQPIVSLKKKTHLTARDITDLQFSEYRMDLVVIYVRVDEAFVVSPGDL